MRSRRIFVLRLDKNKTETVIFVTIAILKDHKTKRKKGGLNDRWNLRVGIAVDVYGGRRLLGAGEYGRPATVVHQPGIHWDPVSPGAAVRIATGAEGRGKQ
jgi:hypothetical protein